MTTQSTVKIHTEQGLEVEQPCFGTLAGLTVTATYGERDRKRLGKYVITHLASGLKFGGFPNRASALRALAACAPITDWTKGKDEIPLESIYEPVTAAVKAAGGKV